MNTMSLSDLHYHALKRFDIIAHKIEDLVVAIVDHWNEERGTNWAVSHYEWCPNSEDEMVEWSAEPRLQGFCYEGFMVDFYVLNKVNKEIGMWLSFVINEEIKIIDGKEVWVASVDLDAPEKDYPKLGIKDIPSHIYARGDELYRL